MNVRRKGARQRPHEEQHPGTWPRLEKLIDPITRGHPESPMRWTCKSTHTLSTELFDRHAIRVSDKTVAKMLGDHGYSLQAPNKSVEGKQHPDRNAQFEHINSMAESCIERGIPVISVDTKKKELVGNFKNGGREWQPKGEPELVNVHDFPNDAVGKAIPYGIYDVATNDGFVSVGVDHDTPVFAVTTIEAWWKQVGAKRYPNAREIFINADAGGSNGYRAHVWKWELQRLADKLGIAIRVSHIPPGTSKWNKIECHLSRSSQSTGGADRCAPTRPSSIRSRTRPTTVVWSCALAWIRGNIRPASRLARGSPQPSTLSAMTGTATGTTSSAREPRSDNRRTFSFAGPYSFSKDPAAPRRILLAACLVFWDAQG